MRLGGKLRKVGSVNNITEVEVAVDVRGEDEPIGQRQLYALRGKAENVLTKAPGRRSHTRVPGGQPGR